MRVVGEREGRLDGAVMIYGLLDPQSGDVRYVGQTRTPSRRRWLHCSMSNNRRSERAVCKWITDLASRGEKPVMVEIEIVALGAENEAEQRHIARFSDLLNMNAGGQSMAQCVRVKVVRTPLAQMRADMTRAAKTMPTVKLAIERMEAGIERLVAKVGRKAAEAYINERLRMRKAALEAEWGTREL